MSIHEIDLGRLTADGAPEYVTAHRLAELERENRDLKIRLKMMARELHRALTAQVESETRH